MKKILRDLKSKVIDQLKELPNFDKLIFVNLFGSQAYGRVTKHSDIDICCYYDLEREELEKMSLKLSSHFPKKYDVSLFQLLPLQIRKEVLKGKYLYVFDKNQLFDIVYKTLEDYRFFKPLYQKVIQ